MSEASFPLSTNANAPAERLQSLAALSFSARADVWIRRRVFRGDTSKRRLDDNPAILTVSLPVSHSSQLKGKLTL